LCRSVPVQIIERRDSTSIRKEEGCTRLIDGTQCTGKPIEILIRELAVIAVLPEVRPSGSERWIEIDDVTSLCAASRHFEVYGQHLGPAQKLRRVSQMITARNCACSCSPWDIERALSVDAVESIEGEPVEVDEPSSPT
jgi:hypothetical protein